MRLLALARVSPTTRQAASLLRAMATMATNGPTGPNATAPSAGTPLGIARPEVGRVPAAAGVSKENIHAAANARRNRRFWMIGLALATSGASTFVVLNILGDALMFYLTPTQVLERDPPMPSDRKFRLGGMVVNGSLSQRTDDGTIRFTITDFSHEIDVVFKGALPQMFSEGTSAVCEGRIRPNGVFEATEVLAKHDENYMPKDIAEQVKLNQAAKGPSTDVSVALSPEPSSNTP